MVAALSKIVAPQAAAAFAPVRDPDADANTLLKTIGDALRKHERPAYAPVQAWLGRLETARDAGRKFTVLEHSVLTFFLKQNVFPHAAGHATPELADERRNNGITTSRIRSLLATSWEQLTGKAPKDLVQKLPLTVLAQASRHDRVWHAASFIPIDTTPQRATQRAASSLIRDYIPTKAHIAAGLAALTIGVLSTAGAQALVGLAVMHAATSAHEYGVHRVMHPWTSLRNWIKNGPREDASTLEKKAHEATFAHDGPNSIADTLAEHDVHHFWTYKRFTEMFSTMPKEKVDALIDRRYSEDHAAKIKADRYASALTWKDIIKLGRTVLPQTALGAGAFLALGAPWALVGVATYLVAYPVATGLVHGYGIHLTREERNNAAWWVRAIKDTSLMHWATASHFMHHESVNDSNFNVCFPGADAAFGSYVQPSFIDLLKMDDEKVVYA